MKIEIIKKTALFLLAIIFVHFSCYFPVASAASPVEMMDHSMPMFAGEYYGCCEESPGICHDVGDMSFLNFITFTITDFNFEKYFNFDCKPDEKSYTYLKSNYHYNSQLENIRTVQIII